MLATSPAAAVLAPLITDERRGDPVRGGRLPASLRTRYGGDLAIPLRSDRPTVVANFVSTIDGVVSYNTPEAAGGGEISGFFEADRFVMGLLRALSDAVLIGAGTLRAAPTERWTADYIDPASAGAYAGLRRELGLSRHPLTAVVTASGSLDMAHPGIADPAVEVVIVTTDHGAEALARQGVPSHVDVRSAGDAVGPGDAIATLASRGADLVLCEGGPHLFGQLLDAREVDEIFLTLAPQIAGRSTDMPRLSLVEEVAFDVDAAPWGRLVDLRVAGDHLFTRYRLNGEPDR